MHPKYILVLLVMVLLHPLKAQLLFNEFQASNITTQLDETFNFRQWVEIYNAGDRSVNLYGYYLSDEPWNPRKFRINENITVSSGGRVILWLDPDRDFYGKLKLDMDGGVLIIANSSGEVTDQITYTKQYVDISYGRESDGASNWGYIKDPTPNGRNDTEGYPYEMISETVVFSLPGGLYSGSQVLELSGSSCAGEIRYTTDGSWPTESSCLYQSSIGISGSMVIRARVFEEDMLPGKVLTNTFFLDEESSIPIVSISTDPDNFFDGGVGIYVEGYRGIPGLCSEEPVNWNRDWERPINVEYFTRDGSQVINQMAGTKIFGGCSRSMTFKSLALYARKCYGDNSFSHQFFTSKDITEFKGLVLRNSGNDAYYSLLRDGFMQNLVMGKIDIDYLGYQPANVFINGEYWGILNVREKINEHYVANNYSIDPNEVDLLEKEAYFDWGGVIAGSGEHYEDLFDYLDEHDLSNDSYFEHISTLMDVEEFMNYYLVQIYFQNEDWPHNNIKYWRYHGEGGKWRWVLFDTDVGWGLIPKTGNALEWATEGSSNNQLIRALLDNENFKNEFIQRMAGFMNTLLHPDTITPILDSIVGIINVEFPRHSQRWGKPSQWNFDYHTTVVMPEFTVTRPDSMKLFMQHKFGIPGLETLSTSVDDPLKGHVEAAGVKLSDQFSGEFFKDVPVRLKALPRSGYTFSHWEGSSTSTGSEIYLDLHSEETVKAVFTPAESIENIFLNEVGASNDQTVTDEYGQSNDWLEIYNDSDSEVDLAGCFLSDSAGFLKMYQFPYGKPQSTTVGAGEYLLIWCDGQSEQGALHTNFKLSKAGESIFLVQMQGAELSILDSIVYAEQYADVAFGRIAESNQWDYLIPTPGDENSLMGAVDLHINEYMTRNDGSFRDEYNEADDWIELYNPNNESVDLAGLFLTDSLQDPLKHQIPFGDSSTIIPPKGYSLLWADGQEEQGVLHLGFKLDSRTEQIGLYQLGAGIVDSLSYRNDYPDVPVGRFPDGSSNLQFMTASPGSENHIVQLEGLFINEFMAKNKTSLSDEFGEFDDWIEIYNANDYPVDLGGIFISDSLENPMKHRIPTKVSDSTTIPAQGYLVLWADGQEEQGVLHLDFKLDSDSEQIGLYQAGAGILDSLSYGENYTDAPVGRFPDGSSNLQVMTASPGSENHIVQLEGLFINEFLAKNETSLSDEFGEFDDWIEIYNANDYPVDLGGIFISDSLENPMKHRIPTIVSDSTTIPAQGYLVLWADGQNEQGVLHLDFKLDGDSEQIGLYQAGAGIVDSLSYRTEYPDVPVGRFPDGNSNLQFMTASPGSENHIEQLEGLFISEFMAKNETSLSDEFGEFDDWIEIYNDNDYPVDLAGVFLTDSLGYPTKHRIPMGVSDSTTIAAHGFLVLWADDQKEQGILHLDFSLSGDGEQIGLVQPDGKHFLDTLSYGSLYADQAFGILETEEDIFQIVSASPGFPNYLQHTDNLYITEVLASGNEHYQDQYGEYDDWIEIYNDNDFKVDIGGLYLSDSIDYLRQFRIPANVPDSTSIEAKGYLVLWADNQPDQGVDHLGFKLRGDGESLALTNIDGVNILDSVSFPNQFKNFSYSRDDNFGEWKHFPPTYGMRNIAPLVSGLLINEFMTSNTTFPDENGEFDDWIEIYNSNNYIVDVGGLYLTDSIGDPTKYRIPSNSSQTTAINPESYLILFADDQKDQGVQHTNFKLSRDGEQIALIHYDERTIIDSVTYPKQFKNASASRLGEDWLSIPSSPGADNMMPDLANLVINEVMGYNKTVVGDNCGEFEDWIELYNKGNTSIDIGGLYFSDSLDDQYMYRLPTEYPDSTTINPYGYLTLWADNSADQGILHLGFKISKTGQEIGVFDYAGQMVDSISYPFISPDMSWGRMPDGYGAWALFYQPTPSVSNIITQLQERGQDNLKLKVYPNPVVESVTFEIQMDEPGKVVIEIVNSQGSVISNLQTYANGAGSLKIPWKLQEVAGSHPVPGIYMYRVLSEGVNYSGKLIIQ